MGRILRVSSPVVVRGVEGADSWVIAISVQRLEEGVKVRLANDQVLDDTR